MSKEKVFSMHLLLLVLLTFSCSRKENAVYEPGMGGVRIDLATEAPATRAEMTDNTLDLDPDDFKVEIINRSGVIFKRWATFAEYKSQDDPTVQMNAGGPYTLRATLGDSTASGWDAWFFKGEQQFTVEPQETVDVSVVCRMANVKVAVNYGPNVISDYESYRTIVSSSRGCLDFDMEHKDEAGWMPVAPLTVDVELTDGDGKTWYFRNGSQISAAPGDFITLNLDTEEIPSQEVGLVISVDRTTNDSTVNVELPFYMLPEDAPLLVPEDGGFDAEGNLSMVEGTGPNANISLNASAGLAGCVMTVSSPYLQSLGWPESLDFLNLSPDEKSIIERDGLVYTVDAESTMGAIDLSAVARKFVHSEDAAANTHIFTIKITDVKGKTAEATFVITPKAADKSIAEIPEANVWAARIENVVLGTADGDPGLLYPEVKTEDGQWTRPAFISTSVSGTSNTFTITGLAPGTKYSVRARYNNGASETVREVTTEAAQQVGNAGFEEWTDDTFEFITGLSIFSKDHTIAWYHPWGNGEKWWDVNSKYTMPGDYSLISLDPNRCNFPSVAYTLENPKTGSKSAMLYTVWVGYDVDNIDSLSAGELFIGQADDSGNHSVEGHDFSSRPSAVKFAYRYTSHNSETFYVKAEIKAADGTVIGSFESTDGGAADSWTEKSIAVNYSDMTKKAATIYLQFKSSSAQTPSYSEDVPMTVGPGNTYSTGCRIGSILYIDDIELIYE